MSRVVSPETLRTTLLLLSILPLLFVLAIAQWSGITYPFQDHWVDAKYIITYYDSGLLAAVRECFGDATNHTRPIVLRLIFLLNGAATDWDIRSEYVLCYFVFVGTLFAHWLLIRRCVPGNSIPAAAALLVISVLAFSPGGHNNHWWSFMLQLTLTNLLSLVAFGAICFAPSRVGANILAAIMVWLAAYILTNGLFLALIFGFLAWLASGRRFTSWTTIFWIANILIIFAVYLSVKLPDQGLSSSPNLLSISAFTLVYLGNPISSLVYFQYPDMYQPHPGIWLSGIFGALGVALAMAIVWNKRLVLLYKQPSPNLLLLVGFCAYAGLSALATGKARVDFDAYGIGAGNYSRYTIFGSYLWFGLLYYCLAEYSSTICRHAKRTALAALLIAGIGSISYARSLPIYEQVKFKDREISQGFTRDGSPTSVDPYLHPTSEILNPLRKDLIRLKIGPYRHMAP